MTMLLFVQEKDSAVLYQEEGHPDRLMPGIGKTAKVIGGGLGSTAGGIKLARVCILLKNLVKNIRKKMLPDRTILLTYSLK